MPLTNYNEVVRPDKDRRNGGAVRPCLTGTSARQLAEARRRRRDRKFKRDVKLIGIAGLLFFVVLVLILALS